MPHMSEEDFIKLVQQAESDATGNIRNYRLRLLAFALLGYGVIFGLLALLILLLGGTAALALTSSAFLLLLIKKKLIIAIIAAVWVIAKALWIKFEKPQGYELTRKSCPSLFAELDHLSDKLDALRIHRVILTDELNAAVVQHPRLGILGFNENVLFVGLQLMLTLSEEEMRSVLAHEMGHLSGNHSRFNGWIYRARTSWQRIMNAFEENDSFGGRLLARFFHWYAPRFSAYSFALARQNEYQADAVAAELTSPETASCALVNVHATAPYIEKAYWKDFFNQADHHPEPPHAPLQGFRNFVGKQISQENMLAEIKQAMKDETHYADTHPALKDRLAALDAAPQLPQSPEISAAHAWLEDSMQSIIDDFDKRWIERNGQSWSNRYQYVQQAKQQLAELKDKDTEQLDDQQLWNLACYTQEFVGDEEAKSYFRICLERDAGDTYAAMRLGVILYHEQDASCVSLFRIARENHELLDDAARFGYHFLNENNDSAAADKWWKEVEVLADQRHKAHVERNSLNKNDPIIPSELPEELKQQLQTIFKDNKVAKKVWIAEKKLSLNPGHRLFLFAFDKKGMFTDAEDAQNNFVELLNDCNIAFYTICLQGDGKDLAKLIKEQGQLIHS